MVCAPANQFCCGCTLNFGVGFTLLVHLVINVAILGFAVGSIFFPDRSMMADGRLDLEVFWAAFAVAGLPFIFSGVIGLLRKDEVPMRGYFFYLMLSMLVDIYFSTRAIFAASCQSLPAELKMGGAFFCGVIELIDIFVIIVFVAFQAYVVYIVWSKCEDLHAGDYPKLVDLETTGHQDYEKTLQQASHYLLRSHYDEGYGAAYGSAAATGFGSNAKIFGFRHEMQYPPPPKTYNIA
ncbi:unnamed protein product [Polarella glacialis]|uniref:Uncharacterized protein n=1 Tax=Polarella glacialis TaxID=89957 RepID=A0A813FGC5_POLGL|nr:unnamed protein product [Polarella glacialis]